jgi:hypothetical protein
LIFHFSFAIAEAPVCFTGSGEELAATAITMENEK